MSTVNAEELRRLSDAATPGKWGYDDDEIRAGQEHVVCLGHHYDEYGFVSEDDAAFIVALVNAYRSNQLQVIERDRLARALCYRASYAGGIHSAPRPNGECDRMDGHRREADAIIRALDSTTGDCPVHIHVAAPDDRCGECGHDLRALCHVRSDSTTGDERG